MIKLRIVRSMLMLMEAKSHEKICLNALALKVGFLYLATEKVSLIMQLRVCIFLSCNSLAKTTNVRSCFMTFSSICEKESLFEKANS